MNNSISATMRSRAAHYALTLCFAMMQYLAFTQQMPAKPDAAEAAAILRIIESNSPLKGATIPADISNRLGATHVGGKYYFTDKPYLAEGAQQLYNLGMRVCKLWFYKNAGGYAYNSNWNLPPQVSLKQLAQHPYYKQAFDLPFATFMLSTSGGQTNDQQERDSAGLIREEEEYYQLARYLLETYRQRQVSFVLENWEGDWIVRGGVGWAAQWGRVPPPADLEKRMMRLRYLFAARQRGVNRARHDAGNSACKVYHAIEVNKVIDAMYGVPTVTTQVLPFIEVDMVSWSAYDATDFDKTGIDLYRGISFIRQHMKPTDYVKERVVFLGEIGIPEMATKNLPREFVERWDTYLAVCLAQKIPWVVQWELYCNEPADGKLFTAPEKATGNNDMKGFWLLRPDGTQGYAMQYFQALLANAGGRLPADFEVR